MAKSVCFGWDSGIKGFLLERLSSSVDRCGLCGASWSVGMLRLLSKGHLTFLSNLFHHQLPPKCNPTIFLPLFIEKFFYVLFGLAVCGHKALNILCVNLRSFHISYPSISIKNGWSSLSSFLKVSLIRATPYLFHTRMVPATLLDRTSIMVAGSLKVDQAGLPEEDFGLGILSGVNMLIRPTTIIVMHCLLAVLFLEEWKAFGALLWVVTVLTTGFVFAGLNMRSIIKRVVLIWTRRLGQRTALAYQSGLDRYGGKLGSERLLGSLLAKYRCEDKRQIASMAPFKKKMWSKKSSAVSRSTDPVRSDRAYSQQSDAVAEGTLGWLYCEM